MQNNCWQIYGRKSHCLLSLGQWVVSCSLSCRHVHLSHTKSLSSNLLCLLKLTLTLLKTVVSTTGPAKVLWLGLAFFFFFLERALRFPFSSLTDVVHLELLGNAVLLKYNLCWNPPNNSMSLPSILAMRKYNLQPRYRMSLLSLRLRRVCVPHWHEEGAYKIDFLKSFKTVDIKVTGSSVNFLTIND